MYRILIVPVVELDVTVRFQLHLDCRSFHIEVVIASSSLEDESRVNHQGFEVVPLLMEKHPTFLDWQLLHLGLVGETYLPLTVDACALQYPAITCRSL
jgi:hypothetical protein